MSKWGTHYNLYNVPMSRHWETLLVNRRGVAYHSPNSKGDLMSHKVLFVEKNGSQGSMNFPTLVLANAYARTVKQGAVVPGGTDDDKPASITKCGSKDEEEAKRAKERAAQLAERQEEAYMEEGTQARLQGASTSEALDRANEARAEVVNECACGKRIAPGASQCYTCRRYG